MMYTKLFISSLFSHRVRTCWYNLKINLIQTAVEFNSIGKSKTFNTDSHNSSLLIDESKSSNPSLFRNDEINDPDIYNQNKKNAYSTITYSLMEKSFEEEEEKYQHKISKIIEIFYSMDESSRPKEIKAVDFDYMVKMQKTTQIKNYFRKIAKVEAKSESVSEYKQEVREAIASKPKPEFGIVFDNETGKPVYKVHNVNLICSWLVSKRIRKLQYARIAQSKLLNPSKVIIDFDYDQHMTVKQHATITAQIKKCIGIWRELDDPINLYFCNLKPESPVAQYLNLDFGSLSSHMIEVTSKSYLDLFPKEKLVYLTADTDNVLNYDPDDIYIIGGMIDTLTNEPLSALKSQREGLRTAKLPLNDYFRIRNEVKSLKIGQVFGIISEIASSRNNDIKEILEKHIPLRIQSDNEIDRLKEKFLNSHEQSREELKRKFSLTDEETEIMLLLAMYYTDRNR